MEALKISGLTKEYNTTGARNQVIKGLNLSVQEKEFICILGPSGCGKSTLLRCIAGFEQYQGQIECAGRRISKPGPDRIMVFQDYNQLFPWKTVEQNITYPLRVQGNHDKNSLRKIAGVYLRKVGLEKYKTYYPHELSGGMKQRVAIAKALAQKPELILMDEPFAALDAITRNRLQKELVQIHSEDGITILFVTHNIQEALTLGTRIVLMGQEGRVVIDRINPLEKPVTPSAHGYGKIWDEFSKSLEEESLVHDEQ